MTPELRKAYKTTRESFSPRQTRPQRPVVRTKPPSIEDEIPDFDDADDAGFDVDLPLLLDGGDEGAPADQMN